MVEKPNLGISSLLNRSVDISFDTAYHIVYENGGQAWGTYEKSYPHIENGSFAGKLQADLGQSSYFGGRKPEDGFISWQKDAISIYNLTRAVTHPYPGAFTFLDGKKFFVWKAYPLQEHVNALPGSVVSTKPLIVNTGKGTLKLLTVQLEGEDEIDGEVFAANHIIENKILGGNT